MTDKQAEALNLAKTLYEESQENPDDYRWQAAHELESLHARVVELEAQLEAIGAGGVESLRKKGNA